MKEVYQDDCLGWSTILSQHNFFTKGRESAALELHSGQLALIVIETNINTFAAIIRDDRHILVRMLESMVHITKSSIHQFLNEHLQMRRICCTWVPHFFMCEQMKWHVEVAKEWVQTVKRDRNFLSKVIMCDKTWIHYFNVKSKCESEVWRTSPLRTPKKYASRNHLARSCYACFLTLMMLFTNM